MKSLDMGFASSYWKFCLSEVVFPVSKRYQIGPSPLPVRKTRAAVPADKGFIPNRRLPEGRCYNR